MFFPPTLTLPDRFAQIIGGLCRALSAQGAWARAAGPLGVLIWNRLCRMRVRFIALTTRVRAGTLPAAAPVRPRAATPRPAASRPPSLLPRQFGWLLRLVPEPWRINAWRVPLEEVLADPETVALVAAGPQAGRILRPMCRMVGVTPPSYLQLPQRPRLPRPPRPNVAKRPPTPEEVDARVARMSRLAFANLIHPETEHMNGRPPNRIGYGRAPPILRPLPKWDWAG